MFDKVQIEVKAGNGGDGAISFRREKFVPFGGPDGGDGGNGGDVVLQADQSMTSLRLFRRGRVYRAEDGGNGSGQKKYGKRGEGLILKVPLGTLAWNIEDEQGVLLADLEQEGQRTVLATGGRGGWGNLRYVSSRNQTPRLAQKGDEGQPKTVILELRLIADVGIIGYPNVGKSSLLAAASAAKPRIADYPFTTLEPVLGVVDVEGNTFVLAEIPGLVENAHLGKGLGHDFLRHAMRTKLLVHLIDGSSRTPEKDLAQVNTELSLFDAELARKPQIVVVNKIDLPEVRKQLTEIMDGFKHIGTDVFFVSAATGEGVPRVMAEAMRMLDKMAAGEKTEEPGPAKVFRPQPRIRPGVRKEGDVFVIESSKLERIVARVDLSNPEVRGQIRGQLTRMGMDKALLKAGVQPGDKVRCGEYQWEW